MTQRTVLGIILVFALTVFTQCTVQKRIYSKGYYISFNKTPKRATEAHEEKQPAVFPTADSLVVEEVVKSEGAQVILTETSELKESFSDFVVGETTGSFGVKSMLNHAKENPESLIKQVISERTKDPEPVAKKQPRNVRTAIVVSMVLLIAAGIGLIYLGLATLNPYIALGGILLALAAIIGLFVGLVVEDSVTNKEKVEEEKKIKKEKEQKLSEEEWYELKQKQYKKSGKNYHFAHCAFLRDFPFCHCCR